MALHTTLVPTTIDLLKNGRMESRVNVAGLDASRGPAGGDARPIACSRSSVQLQHRPPVH